MVRGTRNRQVSRAKGFGIQAPGLRDLRRSFRRLAPEVDKGLKVGFRRVAKPIRDEGRVNAPHLSGKLARSLRISVVQRGVSITSRVPYANVQHWGGSTGRGHQPGVPWSGSIMVEPSLFLSKALEDHEDETMDEMGRVVDLAALRAGWR